MDHLPQLDYAIDSYPVVPCLCKRRYDGLEIDTYPQRCGFDVSQIKSGIFPNHLESEAAAFLQTWLYFGTLHEIFNSYRAVTIEDFTEVKDNAWIISTAKLDEYVNSLLVGLKECTIEALVDEGNRFQSVLEHLRSMTEALCTLDNCPLPNEIILSLSVLGLTLDCAFQEWLTIPIPRSWGLLDLAMNSMAQAGWCPRDIHMLESTCTELTLFYMSYLKRDFYPQEHALCTKQKCQANQLDKRHYVTKHVTKGCKCRHMGPDTEEVKRIIRAGNIPVVNLMPNNFPNDSYDLDLSVKELKSWFQSATWVMPRVISHVWSDGLGNPTANTLPLCQLKLLFQCFKGSWWVEWIESNQQGADPKSQYLPKLGWHIDASDFNTTGFDFTSAAMMKVVKKVTKKHAGLNVWIDTLCVPNGDDECRRLAIENMDKIYGGGIFVIALDSELQHRSAQGERVEALARVAVSGWMRRAWTYQEAIMAQEGPLIKFADGIIGLNQLLFTDFGRYINGVSSGLYAFSPRISRLNTYLGEKFPEFGYERPDEKQFKETLKQLDSIWETVKFIYFDIITVFSDIRSVKLVNKDPGKGDRAKRIKSVWNALQWRNTTKAGDKFIIFNLACCMDPNELKSVTQRVLRQSTIHPMALWLSHQREIPEGLVFVKGPRLKRPAPTWAPADVHPYTIKGDGWIERSVVTNALQLKKPGFLLLDAIPPLDPRSFLRDSATGQMYRMGLDEGSTDWQPVAAPGHRMLAVMLLKEVCGQEEVPALLIEVSTVSQNGFHGFFRSCASVHRAGFGEAGMTEGEIWSADAIPEGLLWSLE